MKVVVTANVTPFLTGGAVYHFEGLVAALKARGHEVDTVRFPFSFNPEEGIERLMDFCGALDLSAPNGIRVDKLISLQFPGYGAQHPDHVVWVMHQHRVAYELYEQMEQTLELDHLRDAVHAFDADAFGRASRVFANSRNVSERLARYNGIQSAPLYHPPPLAEHYRLGEAEAYVFMPSRMERLKRQTLILEAARLWRSPVKCILAGRGGQFDHIRHLVHEYGLEDRVILLETCTDAEKLALYSNCLGVLYPPFDEDYGYVTLEAQLAAKPVITCTDSGGPLEFIHDGEEGFVTEPQPQAMADAVDRLWDDRAKAREMGRLGLARYLERDITWDTVVDRLTG